MTTTVSSFVIKDVQLSPDANISCSIFEDVEATKLRVLELRRAAKRRIDQTESERPSQQQAQSSGSMNDLRDSTNYINVTRPLIEAETQLVQSKAIRQALESRRAELRAGMDALKHELKTLTIPLETPQSEDHPSVESTRKRPRYFEESKQEIQPNEKRKTDQPLQDDLSSVVCPFELMGKCTDTECPHMHLNR